MAFSLDINQNALDQEWLGQPRLAREIHEEWARRRKLLSEAKAAASVARAQAKLSAYSDPAAWGLAKATQDLVEAAIEAYQVVVEADQAVVQAQYDVDLAAAAVEGVNQRKKGLEDLVQLWTMSYFAAPRAPEGMGGAINDAKKRQSRGAMAKDPTEGWEETPAETTKQAPATSVDDWDT